MKVKSEDVKRYDLYANGEEYDDMVKKADDNIIDDAMLILEKRMSVPESWITSPKSSIEYLKLSIGNKEQEIFGCLFLDNRHGVISSEDLFYGTIDGASVHPREVVKAALRYNAAAIILYHNHPSGDPEPSRADISITKRLNDALMLIDIRVLDHIIIGGTNHSSLAEKGLI